MTEQQQIQKGFNQGYLIAKHKPELFQTLSNSLKKETSNLYTKSFLNGGKQFQIEKNKEKQLNKSKEPLKQKQPTKNIISKKMGK
jgi:hypothetical protein